MELSKEYLEAVDVADKSLKMINMIIADHFIPYMENAHLSHIAKEALFVRLAINISIPILVSVIMGTQREEEDRSDILTSFLSELLSEITENILKIRSLSSQEKEYLDGIMNNKSVN